MHAHNGHMSYASHSEWIHKQNTTNSDLLSQIALNMLEQLQLQIILWTHMLYIGVIQPLVFAIIPFFYNHEHQLEWIQRILALIAIPNDLCASFLGHYNEITCFSSATRTKFFQQHVALLFSYLTMISIALQNLVLLGCYSPSPASLSRLLAV